MTSHNQHQAALLVPVIFAMAACPAFSKEKEALPAPPPMAKTGVATAYVGTPVEITLQLAGRIVEPLEFLIRKEPKHGTLGELRRTGRNSAALLYTPNARTGPCDDSFSFAAQSVDSPVSAPATVWVRIVERPAVLEHPEEIDFGKVFLGDKAERAMELKNSGGGTAEGAVRLNLPWRTGKTGDFRLAAGMSTRIVLVFEPGEEREFLDRVQVGPDQKSTVLLRGSGVAPVSWPKDGLVVLPENREEGKAAIAFTNNSPAERTLQVAWPEFFKAGREVMLPANGASSVNVEISAPLSLKYEGEAEVICGNYKSKLPVKVFPAPAKLSASPEHELKLGPSGDGRILNGHLLVKNTGGANAALQIIAPPEIAIFPNPSRVILAGGEEQDFEVQGQLSMSGSSNKTIRIQSPGLAPIDIAIAHPHPPENRAAPVEKFLSISQGPEASPAGQPPSDKLPRVETAYPIKSECHEIEIGWKLASPKISGFKIERRRISPGNEGKVNVEWVPWPEAKVAVADGAAVARFTRLPADSLWTIRIIALDETGKPSPPSPAFQISTKPIKEFHLPAWGWIILVAALGAAAFKIWKKHRSNLHTKADARLASLEAK